MLVPMTGTDSLLDIAGWGLLAVPPDRLRAEVCGAMVLEALAAKGFWSRPVGESAPALMWAAWKANALKPGGGGWLGAKPANPLTSACCIWAAVVADTGLWHRGLLLAGEVLAAGCSRAGLAKGFTTGGRNPAKGLRTSGCCVPGLPLAGLDCPEWGRAVRSGLGRGLTGRQRSVHHGCSLQA